MTEKLDYRRSMRHVDAARRCHRCDIQCIISKFALTHWNLTLVARRNINQRDSRRGAPRSRWFTVLEFQRSFKRKHKGFLDIVQESWNIDMIGNDMWRLQRKKKNCNFDNMLTKNMKRLNEWQGKMLTYGGKVVLIKSVLQALPTYTLTATNPPKACKFRGKKKFNSRRMETQILWKLKAEICVAFPKCKLFEDSYTWIYICQTVERLEPMVSCKIVTWTRPIEVRFKLNSDGSFLRNNQRAGIGGVIRNAKGALVMAYCWKLEVLMNDTMNESS
ncbi:hypothetical protein FXO38_11542 [Capsicum annuum]|nr:hypothetical protein FXO37_19346 [Capsicum annuum]KAF3661728.1 hypothetical protein FXO38_11542 [Capsicum annuum]